MRVAFEKRFGLDVGRDLRHVGDRNFFPPFDVSNERDGKKTWSVGRGMPGMDYQFVDDDGKQQPAGTPVSWWCVDEADGPKRGLLKEYFRDPETTEEVWSDGWFHTSDVLVETPAELVSVDRKKHMVRRSGQNIWPARSRQRCAPSSGA